MKKLSALIMIILVVLLSSVQSNALTTIGGPDIIHKETNQALTIGSILQFYPIGITVESDGFTGYGNIPGTYTIRLRQGDNVKDVDIVVVEKWGLDGQEPLKNPADVLAVTDMKDIWVSSRRLLTASEIVWNLLAVTGYFPNPGPTGFNYAGITDEYTILEFEDDEIPIGVYEFSFNAQFATGFEGTYISEINVYQVPPTNGTWIEPPSSGFNVTTLLWIVGGIAVIVIGSKFVKKKVKRIPL